jgi:hypothetical protein
MGLQRTRSWHNSFFYISGLQQMGRNEKRMGEMLFLGALLVVFPICVQNAFVRTTEHVNF